MTQSSGDPEATDEEAVTNDWNPDLGVSHLGDPNEEVENDNSE